MLKTISPVDVKQQLNASGAAPIYAARAWVNFNGTGTVAINASGNVTSITDNGGTGDYTVNFTTAMQDANYAVMGSSQGFIGSTVAIALGGITFAAGSIRVRTTMDASFYDGVNVCVAVFR